MSSVATKRRSHAAYTELLTSRRRSFPSLAGQGTTALKKAEVQGDLYGSLFQQDESGYN